MMLPSILLLTTFMLSLVGCATTSSVVKPIIVETTERKDYQESDPLKHFSGIEAVTLNRSKIIFTSVDKSLYEEYSVPMITYLHEYHSESHLIMGFFKTTLGIPFYAVLSPIYLFRPDARHEVSDFFQNYTWKYIFGYSKKTIGRPVEDSVNKVKTGKSEWRDTHNAHKILISGFDKDYEFITSTNPDPEEYDLSPYILNTDLTKNTTIKITCLDCDLLGQEEQALYKDAKKTVEITADFREIKATLLAEEKTKRIEQVRHEKEDLQRRKETQGVPLNEFKAQCQALGFKVGSDDYGNCVLELNEAK